MYSPASYLNPEFILKFPEDRRLDIYIAYYYLGWRFMREKERQIVGFYPPEEKGWRRYNFNPDLFEEVDPQSQDKIFADWDKGGGYNGELSSGVYGLPRFSTRRDHLEIAIAHLHQRGYMTVEVRSKDITTFTMSHPKFPDSNITITYQTLEKSSTQTASQALVSYVTLCQSHAVPLP